MSSPSAPKGLVEVGSNSSLGSGGVTVESGGVLRLMGSRNISPNAAVDVQGTVILDPDTKVRISSLRLGATTVTSGLFTQTNGLSRLSGTGTFRCPPPTSSPAFS